MAAARNNEAQAPKAQPLALLPIVAEQNGIDQQTYLALANVFPGARPESVVMAYAYCKARNLDPLKKVVHIVPMYVEDKTTGRSSMRDVIMPGIAESRITASRTGQHAGTDEPVFGPMVDIPMVISEDVKDPAMLKAPEWCKVTVYRLVQGKRFGFTHTEFFAEAVGRKSNGGINAMWQKRPRGQLAKTAEAGALRKGFAEELGGEATADEMQGHEYHPETEVVTPANGPSGIPAPETKQDEPIDADFVDTKVEDAVVDSDQTQVIDKVAIQKIKDEIAVEQKPAPEVASPAPAATTAAFKIDLKGGAESVVRAQMKNKGITEEQLLAKMGCDVTAKNINDALALIKGWA